MKHLLIFLFGILFSFAAQAEPLFCGGNPYKVKALADVSRSSCVQTLQSKECQDLFAKMRAAGEKPEEKALQCHKQSSMSRAFEASWDYTSGCAVGGWNFVKDSVVAIGTAIGEGAAQIVMDHEAEVAANAVCDADPKSKENLVLQYNSSVPKLMQMKLPAAAVMAKTKCADIKRQIKKHRLDYGYAASLQIAQKSRMKDPKYTPEEQEFVDWGKSRATKAAPAKIDLLGAAKAKLKEMGVQIECYNSQQAAAIVCEAIAEVATLAGGPAGVALKAAKAKNIMKLAGIGADAGKASTASRAVASAAELEKAAKLSNIERVTAAEKSLGRSLSETEKKALISAHEVGKGTGRGYGTYSKTDLSDKANILKNAGFKTEERDLLMRQGLAGSLSDTKAARDFANRARLEADKLRVSGNISESTNSYRKASDSYEVFMNDAKAAKSSRDYWVGAKMNASAERYDKAAEYFIKTEQATSRTDVKAQNIFNALSREKDELRVIAARNPASKSAQKNYQDHKKLIEAVVNSKNLQLGDAWKRELLKP
ncbi:hypothetical protein ACNQKP_04405 [Bdellovibrio bacteriovorus]|uniref:hypothetical protein n=1 Tax=Bdellovibrio bacteriovorus TaxID=959 RepID=UPI003AA7C640